MKNNKTQNLKGKSQNCNSKLKSYRKLELLEYS